MNAAIVAVATGGRRMGGMTPKPNELPRDWSPILDLLHDALSSKMEADGLSGRAVAEATGIAQASLSKFLLKTRGLAWNTASALADYLGKSIEVIDLPKKRPAK